MRKSLSITFADVPVEFNIKNYQNKKLELIDWIIQLYLRHQQRIQEDKSINIFGIIDDWSPIMKFDDHYVPIMEVSCKQYIHQSSSDSPALTINQNKSNRMSINNSLYQIDFSAPDSILIERFKTLLDEFRLGQDIKVKRQYTPAILARWADGEVLAYLDLMYWASVHDIELTNWFIGELIFPGSNQGNRAERVRQTTRKYADEVLTEECFRALVAQYRYDNNLVPDLPRYLNLAQLNSQHIFTSKYKVNSGLKPSLASIAT